MVEIKSFTYHLCPDKQVRNVPLKSRYDPLVRISRPLWCRGPFSRHGLLGIFSYSVSIFSVPSLCSSAMVTSIYVGTDCRHLMYIHNNGKSVDWFLHCQTDITIGTVRHPAAFITFSYHLWNRVCSGNKITCCPSANASLIVPEDTERTVPSSFSDVSVLMSTIFIFQAKPYSL